MAPPCLHLLITSVARWVTTPDAACPCCWYARLQPWLCSLACAHRAQAYEEQQVLLKPAQPAPGRKYTLVSTAAAAASTRAGFPGATLVAACWACNGRESREGAARSSRRGRRTETLLQYYGRPRMTGPPAGPPVEFPPTRVPFLHARAHTHTHIHKYTLPLPLPPPPTH